MSDSAAYRLLLLKLATDLYALELRLRPEAHLNADALATLNKARTRTVRLLEHIDRSSAMTLTPADVETLRQAVQLLQQEQQRLDGPATAMTSAPFFPATGIAGLQTIIKSVRGALQQARLITGLPGDDGTDF